MFLRGTKNRRVLKSNSNDALPDRVPMRSLLRRSAEPFGWRRLEIGVDAQGRAHGISDRYCDPHTLVGGTTGSGKTFALRMIAAQSMRQGHEVIVIDPFKSLVDYTEFKPWLKHSATGETDAADLIEQVFNEMKRRFQVMLAHEKGTWFELPAGVRAHERIRPLTVIIDELAAFRPSEASAKLRIYLGSISRQSRAAGVHLVVASQRPGLDTLGEELRANLSGNTILTVSPGRVPDEPTLRVVFGHLADGAAALARRWNNDARGFALVGSTHDNTVTAVRVGSARHGSIPEILGSCQISTPVPGFPRYTPSE